MDYPGTTTYEPTLLHLLILLAVIIISTYPCSLILILLRIVKPAKHGANALARTFHRANEILRAQLVPSFFAWLGGCLVCMIFFLGWVLIGGLIVTIGLIAPVDSIISVPLLVLMLCVHLTAQIIAYRYAIRETSWIE